RRTVITHRRIFQAKVGQAAAVVAHVKEFQANIEPKMGGQRSRVYTDLLSGATDRVAWEFDAESLAELERMFSPAGASEEDAKALQAGVETLTTMIAGR